MGREVDMEKEFSENIDRMLAGKEVKVGPDVDDECRMALDFAQQMVRLRAIPSASFKAELKERLLQKLSGQETGAAAEAKKNWLWESLRRLVPRSVTWRVAAATAVVIIMVFVGVFWHMGGFTQPPAPAPAPAPRLAPTPAPAPPPGIHIPIEADASIDKDSYLQGEEVVIELSFKNVTPELFQLEPFPPVIEVMRPSPYDELVRSFPPGTEIKSLGPGEVATYTLTWDQRDNQGQQVPYGRYYLKLGDIRHGDGWMSLGFRRYVSLLILPAEGVIEKTIEVNESQTVNDITFTLERIELSTSEAKFYVFNIPPNYNLPQGPMLPPPSLMIHAEAEYSLDDGPMKRAGPSGIRFLENGTEHIWDMLDPVPKGTKKLTFVITRLGEWEGPWEFSIPLEP